MPVAEPMLSQTCMYGVRAALMITARNMQNDGKYIPIKKISDELDVSFHFLTKILQVLTHAGILESYKGPNGGVRLAKSGNEVFLMDIVTALDGSSVFSSCVLGLPDCRDDQPCPLHLRCGKALKQIQKLFEETTLAKLAHEVQIRSFRL